MAFLLVRGAVDPNGDSGKSGNDKGATMGDADRGNGGLETTFVH